MSALPFPVDTRRFVQRLLRWFDSNRRPLPWRQQRNWYTTLISEILLQQTQVSQGLPYYYKFIERFPDIGSLAQAEEEEVLQLWAGLGYYARARNLLKCARQLVTRYGGQFPETLPEALALPGIGLYTAAAMLSISHNLPYAAVDGNVLRVVSRLFEIGNDTRLSSTKKQIEQIVTQLISREHPGTFNEALMELGALVCTPNNPQCSVCPLKEFCGAQHKGRTAELPYRSKAPAKKKRRQYVLVLKNEDRFLIARRPASGLLASMWEFPTVTVDRLRDGEQTIQAALPANMALLKTGRPLRHIYSHIQMDYLPLLIAIHDSALKLSGHEEYRWLQAERINAFALHRAHQKIMEAEPTRRWFNS